MLIENGVGSGHSLRRLDILTGRQRLSVDIIFTRQWCRNRLGTRSFKRESASRLRRIHYDIHSLRACSRLAMIFGLFKS